MRNKIAVTVLGICALLLAGSVETRAQSSSPKIDIGGQFSFMHFPALGSNDAGLGGRITYNVNDEIGIEAEVNVFPTDKMGIGQMGRKEEVLAGAKIGFRSKSAGIFAKIRPGFVHFSRDPDGFQDAHTDFAVDFGSVIELYPSSRTVVRFDIGDTAVRFPAFNSIFVGQTPSFWGNNLQISAGVGVRF
ncbi:MAG TPA: outer membrane beta-barrel protein [Blastocatellia bacterium]|nr:outer membrane beta-barrel protein [Blastocatellia bacterium]